MSCDRSNESYFERFGKAIAAGICEDYILSQWQFLADRKKGLVRKLGVLERRDALFIKEKLDTLFDPPILEDTREHACMRVSSIMALIICLKQAEQNRMAKQPLSHRRCLCAKCWPRAGTFFPRGRDYKMSVSYITSVCHHRE